MSGRVSHFELPVDDLERARRFYSEVLGWNINEMPGVGSIMVGTTPSDEYGRPTVPGGINGGLAKRGEPIKTPVITVDVADIDATLSKAEELGGKRVQDKTPVGTVGFVAYFVDTEGSVIGLWQNA